MGRGVNTGALSPVGGIGEIRMRANLRKIVAYKDFAKQNEALIELSKIYDIVWRQCPCLKGIMNTNVTPELERLACEQMKG